MKIRSLIRAATIAAASLTMAGASWAPACAQDDPFAELLECFRGCNAAWGPNGISPNPAKFVECRQVCCEEANGLC